MYIFFPLKSSWDIILSVVFHLVENRKLLCRIYTTFLWRIVFLSKMLSPIVRYFSHNNLYDQYFLKTTGLKWTYLIKYQCGTFPLTQNLKGQYRHDQQGIESEWLKIIPHMIHVRSYMYYRCCCLHEPVIFSHCIHLTCKLGHRFHALLKECSDRDDSVPLIM